MAGRAAARIGGGVVSLRDCLRQITKPGTGRRRAVHPADPAVAMLRPVETLVTDEAYCPAENRITLHAFLRTGGRVCWTCRTVTTAPTPPGGAA